MYHWLLFLLYRRYGVHDVYDARVMDIGDTDTACEHWDGV